MALDVEVLIVSYASAAVIDNCLASLEMHVDQPRVAIREHSASAQDWDALLAVVARHNLDVRCEYDPANPGFGAGCNALAAGSNAQWLLFLNPDTELMRWPYNEAAPPPGTIVGPLFTEAPGQHAGQSYRVRDEIARSWLRRTGPLPAGRGFVRGATLLIERQAFADVGGFDPSFFLFYEDIDLCLRANQHGIATVVDRAWSVKHARGHSTSERFDDALRWSYDSAVYFHGKHGSTLSGYRAYVVTDSVARACLCTVRRNPRRAKAYLALARHAAKSTGPEPASVDGVPSAD